MEELAYVQTHEIIVWHVPSRIFQQSECESGVDRVLGVDCPGHGLILENSLLPVGQGSAITTLILKLST
jgi:hypothetical protein